MKKKNKLAKAVMASAMALGMLAATASSSFAAVAPDDWNIASETGIQSLDNTSAGSAVLSYNVGDVKNHTAFSPYFFDGTPVEYRMYRTNYENEAQKLKTLTLENWTIATGGDYAYTDSAGAYTFTTGFPTGKYYPVHKFQTQVDEDTKATVFERQTEFYIVNSLQQLGIKPYGTSRVQAQFTFFSPTKGDHTGKTGTIKILSPSGTVVQQSTFTLGANQLSSMAKHTMFQSAVFSSITFEGYLSGTYKLEYTYPVGGTNYVDSASIVVSGGQVVDVYENN